MELNSHVLEDKLVDEQYYVIDHGGTPGYLNHRCLYNGLGL